MITLKPVPRRLRVPRGPALLVAAWLAVVTVAVGLERAGVPGPPLCTFRRVTDLPCPSCGATRATLAVVRGHPVEALGFNPLFCVVAAAAAAVLGLRVLGGRGVSVRLSTGGRRLAWGLAAIAFTMNWAYVIWRDGGQA